MIWELTFGIYLIAKGFTSAARRRTPTRGPHRPQPSPDSVPGPAEEAGSPRRLST